MCVASGRPIAKATLLVRCSTCRHYAYQREVSMFRACPLCHAAASGMKSVDGALS